MAGLEEDELLSTIAEMKEAGYSYKEISKRTGITPMAVRSRWRRMTGTHLKGAQRVRGSEQAGRPPSPAHQEASGEDRDSGGG